MPTLRCGAHAARGRGRRRDFPHLVSLNLGFRFRPSAQAAAWWAALAAFAAGALTLIGWLVPGGSEAMRVLAPLTAAGFPLVAVGLALGPDRTDDAATGWRGIAGVVLGTLVTTAGLAAVVLDFAGRAGLGSASAVPWSSLSSALGLAALGFSVALAHLRVSREFVAPQLAALSGALMGLFSLQHLLTGHAPAGAPGGGAATGLVEAAGLVALGLIGFFRRADRGLAAVINSRQTGGTMARTVLPLILGAPLVVAWIHHRATQAGWLSAAHGLPVFAGTTVVLALVVIWRSARSLNRIDVVRTEAEAALRETTGDLQLSNEQLQRSEERLRLALEGAGLATWHWNLLTGSLSWSPHVQVLYGYAHGARVTRAMIEGAIHPGDRPAMDAAVKRAIESGGSFHFEFRVTWPDGSVHWLASRGRAFRGEGGRAQRVEGITMDVTARRQAEEDLRFAREQLEAAQNRVRLGSWSFDLRTRQFTFSAQMFALLRRDPALGPTTIEEFLHHVHPEDRARALEVWQSLDRLEEPRRGEVRTNPELGPVRYLSSTIETERAPDGTPVLAVGTLLDITEQRLAELETRSLNADLERRVHERTADAVAAHERIQAVMDAATAVAIVATDLRGTITLFSRGAERMLGYDAAGMTGRQTPVIYHVPAEIEALGRELSARAGRPIEGFGVFAELARAGDTAARDWTFVRRDGSRLPVELVVSPLHEHGVLVGTLGVARDMTERKAFEEQLRGAKVAAEEATRAKSEFLAVMSHEIRTPVNGVIGMTHLLLDSGLNPRQGQIAQTINSSAESLLSIINDVLDFSKIEARKLELEILDFDLALMLEETIELLAPRAQARHLELVGLVEPGTPLLLRGDPGRIRQVLTNLVANAIKFTDEGDVTVRVQATGADAAGVRLRFTVSDTGIGIDAETQKRLFHAFTQADASMTRRFGGTGLGLAISRQLVELMDGRIGVSSEPGSGSSFHFEITLRTRPPAGPGRASRVAPPEAQGARVLVATAHEALGAHVSGLLRQWRLAPVVAASLDDAAAGLAGPGDDRSPALVIADSAFDPGPPAALAHRLTGGGSLPCILLTTVTQSLAAGTMPEGGSVIQVNKPVRQADLFDAVTRLLGGEDALADDDEMRSDRPGDARRTRLRILLAEDNITNQQVALGHLEKLGCRADVVANGLEAIEAVTHIAYDVVLMDCMMPEMDGFAATAAIRDLERRPGSALAERPRLTVIALTANAMIGDRERCLNAGMDDYVVKPVRLSELRRALDAAATGATRPEDSLSEEMFDFESPPATAMVCEPALDAPVDLDHLLGIFSHEVSQVSKVLVGYVEQADVLHREIAGAVARRAAAPLRDAAHKWRGASANCGIVAVLPSLAHLEQLAHDGDLGEAAAVLSELDAAWPRTRAFLVEYIQTAGTTADVPARPAR